jgi:hypothetical protein
VGHFTGTDYPIPALREAFRRDLADFLSEDNPRLLKIYNPTQVVGSKQLSEPKQFQTRGVWQRGAALWSVTPVEVTRLVSENCSCSFARQNVLKSTGLLSV